MNEHSLNDPQLKSLEARLAGLAPQLPVSEQQQLLYECGVAAGRKSTRGALRRWQAIAAGLLVVAVATISIPRSAEPQVAAEQHEPEPAPVEIEFPRFDLAELFAPSQPKSPLELDAWQTPRSRRDSLADELARFEETDPHVRTLAMGAMARSLLRPESR
jgi:hypothetical protein